MNEIAMTWDIRLTKRFEGRKPGFALDVNFRSPARRLVLFGPSGAGKSVTLKMIAGLSAPDHGHVRLEGTTLYDRQAGIDLSPQRRGLSYVFQDYALFPHLTVAQNIAFGLHTGLMNPPRKVKSAAVAHWVRIFHLESVIDQYPEQISGGQRQRTALARALVAQPRALLLDEPFAALDRALRRHLRQELIDLQEQLDIPLILITHDEEDVDSLADAVIRINRGCAADEEAVAAEENAVAAEEDDVADEAVDASVQASNRAAKQGVIPLSCITR